MRNLLLRYSSLLVFLVLAGFGSSYAHAPQKSFTHTVFPLISKSTSSDGEKRVIKVAPIEVREEEEDKHESTLFGKYIEFSLYFNNALPQGYFFSIEESLPTRDDSFQSSPDQYLLLRVFRI